MHVKRSLTLAERRRLVASASTSDSEAFEDDEPLSSIVASKKRKSAASKASEGKRKTSRQAAKVLNEALEPSIEEQDEAEAQLLAIETRRLDFQVAKWKQQQTLRRETLRLKSEEIDWKEATTRQQQQTQAMQARAGVLKALDEAGKPPAQAREYLELLEG